MPSPLEGLFNFTEPVQQKRRTPLQEMLESYQAAPRPKLDAYSEMMNQIPQREDYKMGTGGKIANALVAGLAGLTAKSGQDAAGFAMNLKDRPYKQAMEDFSIKAQGAKEAADLESEVANQRDKVYEQMLEIQDKIEDNSRADTETSIKNFRALTMEKYLENKAKRDTAKADRDYELGQRRAGAQERQAGASESRARSYGQRIGQLGKGGGKPPTEASKRTAKLQAIDYLAAVNPVYNKFVQRDEVSKAIIGYRPDTAAADPTNFEKFVQEVESMQMQSLQNSAFDEDDSDILAEFEDDE